MRRIEFLDFQLDLETFQLSKVGKVVQISPRPLDLLIYLIENRARVIELEELREQVWGATALSRSSIPTCVRELRIALSDPADNPKLIATARGRGYRFIGKLKAVHVDHEEIDQRADPLPFVGRAAEKEFLQRQYALVASQAECRMVLIRGEPGIGKTRLLSEFLNDDSLDVRHCITSIPEDGAAPAFWPWTQILRKALNQSAHDNRELTAHAQVLSSVFPEIHQSADLLCTRTVPVDRHLLLSQWARAIQSISPIEPFVICFEDIHRSDLETLDLLAWISRELANEPLLLIATHRCHAVSDSVNARLCKLAAMSNCESIDLTPLSAKSIAGMLDPLMDHRDRTARALRSRTSGNPFYLTHLIRYLGHQRLANADEAEICAMSPNGMEIVAHQLSDLPMSTQEALASASASGSSFSAVTLAMILRKQIDDVLDDLQAAIASLVLIESDSGYEFSHSLLRDALYQSVSSSGRRRLHLAYAHAIRDQSGSVRRSVEIAEHLVSAHPLGEARDVWQFAILAGNECVRRFSYSRAQLFFSSALRVDEDSSVASPDERLRAMLELADAQLYAGDKTSSRRTVVRASELARTANSPELFAISTLRLAPDFLAIEVGTSDSVLIRQLEEAIAILPEHSNGLRSMLFARLSLALQWSDQSDRSKQLATESLRLARETGDPVATSAALSALAETLHGPGHVTDRISVLSELGEIQHTTSSIAEVLVQRTRVITALLEAGDLEKLDAENEVCRQLAVESRLPQLLWYPESMDSMRLLMKGYFTQIETTLSDRFREILSMGEDTNILLGFAVQRLFFLVETDRLAEALGQIEPLIDLYPRVRSWRAGAAWIQWLSRSDDDATSLIDSFDADQISALFEEAGAGVGIATLAEVTASLGTDEQILDFYDRIKRFSNRCATAGYGVLYMGCYARYCGLLARALGSKEVAIRHLSAAIRHERVIGASLWQAYSEIDLALALFERDPLDTKVATAIEDAQATCATVNTPRLNRRLQEMLAIVGNQEFSTAL